MTEEVVLEQPNPTENVLQADPPAPVVEPESIVEVVDPAPEPEPVPAPTPENAEAEDKRKNPWFLKRISETTERARLAEERAAAAEALAERLQAGNKETPAPVPPTNSPDFQTAVQREAARLRLAEDSTAIRDAGYREFGQAFSQNLAVLNAAGAVSDDIVLDLIAVDKDNAHKILAQLAQDPEQATALATMDSRRRTAALTRLSMATTTTPTVAPKTAAPPVKQVSKAPAPAPAVVPSAAKVVDGYSDEASDEEFTRQFNQRMKERSVRRR